MFTLLKNGEKRWRRSKWKFTWVSTKAQLVLSPLARNCKHVVLGVSSFAGRVFQIYSKSVFCFRQTVYLVQSQPKLAIQVTEAILVVGPAAVEINGAVQPLLENCPTPTSCVLVTEHIKCTITIRVDCVNTAEFFTRLVQLSTVLLCCEIKYSSIWFCSKPMWWLFFSRGFSQLFLKLPRI